MSRSITFLAGAVIATAAINAPARAQGVPQTLGVTKLDPQTLATGYRVSKVISSTVVNESDEKVGTIDDLIVTPNEKVPFVILSVGGFLGVGSKYVAIPASSLQFGDKKVVLRGATKDSLTKLPAFSYNT